MLRIIESVVIFNLDSNVVTTRNPSAAHTNITINDTVLQRVEGLMDTGAKSQSYADKTWVDRHRSILQPFSSPVNLLVTMADGVTIHPVQEALQLSISITAPDNSVYTAEISFLVFPMGGEIDLVVGLPDIIINFRPLLGQLLDEGYRKLRDDPDAYGKRLRLPQRQLDSGALSCASSRERGSLARMWTHEELRYPWHKSTLEPVPEEDLITEPDSAADISARLDTPYQEAVAEYERQIEELVPAAYKAANPTWKEQLMQQKVVNVYVHTDWTGLRIPPIEFDWAKDTPEYLACYQPKVVESMRQNIDAEIDRQLKYMYTPSTSRVCSPPVYTPKDRHPWVRICGNFSKINKFIVPEQTWQFDPRVEIEKLRKGRFYCQEDMANSYHQFPIGPITAQRLAIKTHKGVMQPRFIPEGTNPASAMEQHVYNNIFAPLVENAIVIHDGVLLIGETLEHLHQLRQELFDICDKWNVKLKISKSEVAMEEIEFFGLVVSHNSVRLSKDRLKGLAQIPFPECKKDVQRALGTFQWGAQFIPRYAALAAPISAMVKDDFDWKHSENWRTVKEAAFNELKRGVAESWKLAMPDRSLQWGTLGDASDIAAAAAIYQLAKGHDGAYYPQVLGFWSHAFSGAAKRWPAHKKELFAIVASHQYWEHWLRGKWHMVETDHRNLLYLEASEEAILQRWAAYMRQFQFAVCHRDGRFNPIDYPSRAIKQDVNEADIINVTPDTTDILRVVRQLCNPVILPRPPVLRAIPTASEPSTLSSGSSAPSAAEASQPQQSLDETTAVVPRTPEDLMRALHNSTVGHTGARVLWYRLNKFYPGHGISFQEVMNFVSRCGTCQITRRPLEYALEPLTANLRQPSFRSAVGCDFLTITPTDKVTESKGLLVIINLFARHVFLVPVKAFDAESAARGLFQYFTTFQRFEILQSDPGSHFINEVFNFLTRWLGMTRKIALSGRHQSCGVERVNKEILRHASAMVHDRRIHDRWDDALVLGCITDLLNNEVNSETGYTANQLMFGTIDTPYFGLPTEPIAGDKLPAFIDHLNNVIADVRAASLEYQRKLNLKRQGTTRDSPNYYQKGDFVLHLDHLPGAMKPSKLTPPFSGPYEVVSHEHEHNTVVCKHMTTHEIKPLYSGRLKIYEGTRQQAFEDACRDSDQYRVIAVLDWRGDPEKRTFMQFLVHFDDGTKTWLHFSKDLWENATFAAYCEAHRPLHLLNGSAQEAERSIVMRNRLTITEVQPGNIVFVDLRAFKTDWYNNTGLPSISPRAYVAELHWTRWTDSKAGKEHRQLDYFLPAFNQTVTGVGTDWVYRWGSVSAFDADRMVRVTEEMVTQYPGLAAT